MLACLDCVDFGREYLQLPSSPLYKAHTHFVNLPLRSGTTLQDIHTLP